MGHGDVVSRKFYPDPAPGEPVAYRPDHAGARERIEYDIIGSRTGEDRESGDFGRECLRNAPR
jgi:hypothetical protein